MVCGEDGWTDPAPLPLSGAAVQAPAFSPDGAKLYYQAGGGGSLGSLDLWWVDARDEAWTQPVNVGPPVNTPTLESQPTLAANGTLYFTAALEGVGFDRGIYRCVRTPTGYAAPEPLNATINSEAIDYCPYVAPDESYLLFASSRGHDGEELYLHAAFRTASGAWTAPVNFHDALAFPEPARFPWVSPDGKYLFFLSGGHIYWVDASVILEAR